MLPYPITPFARIALLTVFSMPVYAEIDYSSFTSLITIHQTVDVNPVQQLTESFTFNSEAEFVNALNNNIFDDASIYRLAGGDPQASAIFNIQGGNVTLSTDAGSSNIKMTSDVPLFNQTFSGNSREESSQQLKQWVDQNAGLIKSNTGGTGSNPETKNENPISPINPFFGGGPTSPVSFIPAFDTSIDNNGGFSNEFLDRISSLNTTGQDSSVSIATRFSNYCTGQKCTQFYSLPIGWTKELGNEWAVLFKLPLTYINADNISSYSVALSSGLRIPASRYINMGSFKWDVIPLFSLGGIGSDNPSIQTNLLYSGGIQSNLGTMIRNGYAIIIQNQFNHFVTTSSAPILVNEQVFRSDIVNDVFRNGVKVAKNFNQQLFGRRLTASIFFVDTRFSGDLLAIDNQQEFGFDVGLKALKRNKSPDFNVSDVLSGDKIKNTVKSEIANNDIRIGITYTRAKNIDDGFSANMGWTF